MLVDIVFTLVNVFKVFRAIDCRLLSNGAITFGQYDQLVARYVVFLDGLPNYLFRGSIGVDVGSIPLFPSVYSLVVHGPSYRHIPCSRLYRRLL